MNYSELKKAYQLVTKDLFTKLVKAKDGESIKIGSLGSLGSFKKTEHQQRCNWEEKTDEEVDNRPIYAFYKVNFRMSRKLRSELSRVLEKKYRK